jgi:2-(1,2-epoxy-1,2-dihydrophenyl)acetyl-CoA isomerase
MPEENPITLTLEAGVATVELNRPHAHNALDVEMLDRLPRLLRELSEDEAVRCVVITGAGDRAFCAGGDISGLGGQEISQPAELVDRLEGWAQAPILLHEMPMPTLAVVNGTAAGAGMALALACDLRVASENARFITSFARIAMPGDFGGSYFLTQLVGPSKARELYYLSEPVAAEEALTLGIVNWVVPGAELREHARERARRLAAMPRLTSRSMKRNLNASLSESLRRVVRLEAEATIEAAMSEETRAAARAFFEKK